MSTKRSQDRTELLQGTLDLLILRTLRWGPRTVMRSPKRITGRLRRKTVRCAESYHHVAFKYGIAAVQSHQAVKETQLPEELCVLFRLSVVSRHRDRDRFPSCRHFFCLRLSRRGQREKSEREHTDDHVKHCLGHECIRRIALHFLTRRRYEAIQAQIHRHLSIDVPGMAREERDDSCP
jgi:hypothetical protein